MPTGINYGNLIGHPGIGVTDQGFVLVLPTPIRSAYFFDFYSPSSL
ncbi:hypothetical protein [Enterococcus innesii]|nr:hypothetical protein [Enterococcus innesii]